MKIKLELFGASRDFSDKDFLEFVIENEISVKDVEEAYKRASEKLSTKLGGEKVKKTMTNNITKPLIIVAKGVLAPKVTLPTV